MGLQVSRGIYVKLSIACDCVVSDSEIRCGLMMGLDHFREQLDILTGRHAMRKRPTHGRLYSTPATSRLPYGTDQLEDVGIEGTRMRLPHTSPRSFNPYPSSSLGSRGVSSLGSDSRGSPMSMPVCVALGETSPRKDENTRRLQRKSYSSPLYDPETLRKSRQVRFEAPRTASSSPQPSSGPPLKDAVLEQIDVPQTAWEGEFWPLEGESFEVVHADEDHQANGQMVQVVREPTPPLKAKVRDPPKLVPAQPLPWSTADIERVLAPPEAEVVEELPEEEPMQPVSDVTVNVVGCHSCETERVAVVPDTPTCNLVLGATNIPLVEATEDTSAKPSATPSPKPSLKVPIPQAATKPKPKPKKVRPPPVEKTPKPSRPKPEKALPQPKPVKQPKPAPFKQPKPPKPKPEPKEKKKEPMKKNVPLPVSIPEPMPESDREPTPVLSKSEPPPPTAPVHRVPVKKKEKMKPPLPRRRTPTPPPQPPPVVFEHKDHELTYSDDEEEKEEEKKKEETTVTVDLPALPPALPDPSLAGHRPTISGRGTGVKGTIGAPLSALRSKPRWGQKQRDTSLLDDEERERLAEERRRKIAAIMDHHRGRKGGDWDGSDDGGSGYDDYFDESSLLDGFLEKYCILTASTTDKYRYTFEHMDEGHKGHLSEEETAYALRAINPSLSTSERTYLFRVLEMVGHRMKHGTNLKLFSILAALSQRVSKLDEWARNMLADFDYKHLERKLFLAKTLWECNVDDNTRKISLDQMIVELRAGGISPQHEAEVRHKLGALRSLDFFDFLMYVPLFVMIHETVVTDPLSVIRET